MRKGETAQTPQARYVPGEIEPKWHKRWDDSGLLVLVNLGTYGALWLLKFLVLDRLVWPSPAVGRFRRAERGQVRAG